jgi:N-acetylmuramoyl-L-alanine amidase
VNIVPRKEWGAVAPRSRTRIPTPVPRLWLHHTGSTADSGARTVLAIQRFHMGTRGWADIAYSWLYSQAERTFFEGRGAGVAGAHTRGDNDRSHGLAVLGNFDVQTLPAACVDDLRAFLAWHG